MDQAPVTERLFGSRLFGHHDKKTRTAGPVWIRERQHSGLGITKPAIVRRQLFAQVHDMDVHDAAAALAGAVFGRVDETPAKPLMLTGRCDRQHPEIPAIAGALHIDATRNGSSSVFRSRSGSGF